MKSFVVAIPSYQRPVQLREKTLAFLFSGGVKASQVYIFVANASERKVYEAEIPKSMYREIIVGKIGIQAQRRVIARYFPEGQSVVSIDDDIERLEQRNGTKFATVKDVKQFIVNAFKMCNKHKAYMWGIYPVRNTLFMKDRINIGLNFIVGTFYGFVSRPKLVRLLPEAKLKEDMDQSIRYFLHDGQTVRFDAYTVKTKYFNPKGGVGSMEKRRKLNDASAKFIQTKYPRHAAIKKRKNGMLEIRLFGHKNLHVS